MGTSTRTRFNCYLRRERVIVAKTAALQLYRIVVLVAIAWTIRAHHVRLRVDGNTPIRLEEVRAIFPAAAELRPDAGERRGMNVWNADGHQLGYVLTTSPLTDDIIGYRGWTDTLIAFDPALKVLGVRVRSSQDTRDHVEDIATDRYFMKTWNGKPWEEVARTTPEQAGIEGVSGATMTSMAMAEAIMRRVRAADSALVTRPPPLRFGATDLGLAMIIGAAITLAFTKTYGRQNLRRSFQVLVIVYVGFLSGDLLAQSIFAGWAQSGAPWRTAPGLVLLLAASLVVPWTTGKALYCQHLCPHGAAQELLHRMAPKHWRIALPRGVDAGLRWLPPLLIAVVLTSSLLLLPIDLANLEPFDAYSWRSAGWATIAIAVAGLIASLFVPMAYCHYGCPTGALLNFIRSHGRSDGFGRREIAAGALLGCAMLLSQNYQALHQWMVTFD